MFTRVSVLEKANAAFQNEVNLAPHFASYLTLVKPRWPIRETFATAMCYSWVFPPGNVDTQNIKNITERHGNAIVAELSMKKASRCRSPRRKFIPCLHNAIGRPRKRLGPRHHALAKINRERERAKQREGETEREPWRYYTLPHPVSPANTARSKRRHRSKTYKNSKSPCAEHTICFIIPFKKKHARVQRAPSKRTESNEHGGSSCQTDRREQAPPRRAEEESLIWESFVSAMCVFRCSLRRQSARRFLGRRLLALAPIKPRTCAWP